MTATFQLCALARAMRGAIANAGTERGCPVVSAWAVKAWADQLETTARPEAELLGLLADLRHEMCDVVTRTPIHKREHQLALFVWQRIESMRPALTPDEWRAMETP